MAAAVTQLDFPSCWCQGGVCFLTDKRVLLLGEKGWQTTPVRPGERQAAWCPVSRAGRLAFGPAQVLEVAWCPARTLACRQDGIQVGQSLAWGRCSNTCDPRQRCGLCCREITHLLP